MTILLKDVTYLPYLVAQLVHSFFYSFSQHGNAYYYPNLFEDIWGIEE